MRGKKGGASYPQFNMPKVTADNAATPAKAKPKRKPGKGK